MIYLILAAGIFLLELRIKHVIETRREEGKETKACGGALLIRKYHNRGAFLNAGEKAQPFVAVLSLLLTAGVAGFLAAALRHRGKAVYKTGLALLLGGGCSNTCDRLHRKYVVDYFSIRVGKLKKVVFNLGDIFIFLGAGMMLLAEIAEAVRER